MVTEIIPGGGSPRVRSRAAGPGGRPRLRVVLLGVETPVVPMVTERETEAPRGERAAGAGGTGPGARDPVGGGEPPPSGTPGPRCRPPARPGPPPAQPHLALDVEDEDSRGRHGGGRRTGSREGGRRRRRRRRRFLLPAEAPAQVSAQVSAS